MRADEFRGTLLVVPSAVEGGVVRTVHLPLEPGSLTPACYSLSRLKNAVVAEGHLEFDPGRICQNCMAFKRKQNLFKSSASRKDGQR